MNILVVLATVVVVLPTVSSLRCGACLSTTSHSDCYQNMRTEDCYSDEQYRCARASYRINGKKKYYRGCLKLKTCNPEEYCKTADGKTECVVNCCQGDLCNSAPKTKFHKCYFSETQIHPGYCFVRNNTVNNNVSCDPNLYTCGVAQYTDRNGVRHFLRGCLNNNYCWTDRDKPCKDQPETGRTNCNFYCCEGDYTNKGLACGSCVSDQSDSDCLNKMKNEECPLGQEYVCARASYKFDDDEEKQYYHRGCMPKKECKAKSYCEGKTNCTIDCCQGDLCNSKPSSTRGEKCQFVDKNYYDGALSTSATLKAMNNMFILSGAIAILLLNV